MIPSPSRIEALESRIAPATLYSVSLQSDGPHLVSEHQLLQIPQDLGLLHNFDLPGTEAIVDLDFRPASGRLELLTRDADNHGRLYSVNLQTAQLGSPIYLQSPLPGGQLGIDFDPQSDTLRIVGDGGENLQVNLRNGNVSNLAQFTFDNEDAHAGAEAHLTSIAYAPTVSGQKGTLYGIDLDHNTLVKEDANRPGVLHTVGSLSSFDLESITGFDIADDSGYGQLILQDDGQYAYFRVDLGTGEIARNENIPLQDAPHLGLAQSLFSASFTNGKTLTYKDVDGDTVTIKVSKGSLVSIFDTLRFIPGGTQGGAQLAELDLSDEAFSRAGIDPASFKGATLTITAGASATGDGFAHIGSLNTSGVAFKSITVDGDLGKYVGGGSSGNGSLTLAGLTVQSLGALGTSTQGPDGDPLKVDYTGAITKLTVKTSIYETAVNVSETLATAQIGGSLYGSSNDDLSNSGSIIAKNVKSITVKGSLHGDEAYRSGSIYALDSLGTVKIGGSVFGGRGESSGSISAGDRTGPPSDFLNNLTNLQIGGSLLGGQGTGSGLVYAKGSITKAAIAGNVIGGSGSYSGGLVAEGNLTSGLIGGNLTGASGSVSGHVFVQGFLHKLVIRGSVSDGSDQAGQGNPGGLGTLSGIRANAINSLQIGGNLVGQGSGVSIAVAGSGLEGSLALNSLTVGGDVRGAQILAGYDANGDTVTPDVGIGNVKVGGDWTRSNLVAGINKGQSDFYGQDPTEGPISGANPALIAVIKSINIAGQVISTADRGDDNYGFFAEQINKLKIGGVTYRLTATPDRLDLGTTGDVLLREYTDSIF